MKIYILLLCVSIFLIYTGGTWAYVMYIIYTKGSYLVEPDKVRLLLELGLSSLFAAIGFGSFIAALWGILSSPKGGRDDNRRL